jgi:hypothetical protein
LADDDRPRTNQQDLLKVGVLRHGRTQISGGAGLLNHE